MVIKRSSTDVQISKFPDQGILPQSQQQNQRRQSQLIPRLLKSHQQLRLLRNRQRRLKQRQRQSTMEALAATLKLDFSHTKTATNSTNVQMALLMSKSVQADFTSIQTDSATGHKTLT